MCTCSLESRGDFTPVVLLNCSESVDDFPFGSLLFHTGKNFKWTKMYQKSLGGCHSFHWSEIMLVKSLPLQPFQTFSASFSLGCMVICPNIRMAMYFVAAPGQRSIHVCVTCLFANSSSARDTRRSLRELVWSKNAQFVCSWGRSTKKLY